MLFGRPEEGANITRFWLRGTPMYAVEAIPQASLQLSLYRNCEDGVLGEEEEQSISAHSGDAWFRILNQNDEPSILDFRLDAAHGCDIKVFPEAMALLEASPCALELLLLAAFDEPKQIKPRRRSRPSTAAYITSAQSVEALQDVDGSVNVLRVDAKVPLDFKSLSKHYHRLRLRDHKKS
eukprot:g5120.t1